MNVQCKNKKCNKINNELVQVVRVMVPLNMWSWVCFVAHAYEREKSIEREESG